MKTTKTRTKLYEVLYHSDGRLEIRALHPILVRILTKNKALGVDALYKKVSKVRLIESPLGPTEWANDVEHLKIVAQFVEIMDNAECVERVIDERLGVFEGGANSSMDDLMIPSFSSTKSRECPGPMRPHHGNPEICYCEQCRP